MEACIELVWMCSVCGCGWKVVQLPSVSAVPPYWAIFSTLCGVRVLLPLYFNSYITQRRGYNLLVFTPSLFLVYNITWKKVPETTPAHSAEYWTQVVSEKKSKDAKNNTANPLILVLGIAAKVAGRKFAKVLTILMNPCKNGLARNRKEKLPITPPCG